MSIDLTDEAVIQEREKQVGLEEQQWEGDLKTLMRLPAGQRVLWKILDHTRMLSTNVYAGSTNETMHRLGQRDVGIWLYNELVGADISLFQQMLNKEQDNART